MVGRKIILSLVMICISVSFVFGGITKSDIDKAVNKNQLKHPYLYFSEEDKPAILQRINNDPESINIMKMMLAEANKLIHMPVSFDIPVQGRNTRAGWTEADRDRSYMSHYSSTRNNAFLLAFVYQMTGDERYARKAFEFADAFCDFTTWTHRAHEFPIIYSRIMPWNVPDDQVNFSFDHFNGDSGRMMAAVYDWLYPALNIAQRDRIRGALLEKVITRVRGNYEYHWWATAFRCNWCGVCNSGLGLTAIALLTEDPHLTDVIAESYNRINSMFNELGVDGGWQEGGGYWNYGVHTSAFFADALKRLTKGKYNLFENERLKNNPTTFAINISIQPGMTLNFEDSNARRIGTSHLINKLAAETGSKEAAWYRNIYFNEGDDIFDIIWPRPSITTEAPKKSSIHFRTIDWWVMRSEMINPEKVVVAGKAGMNDDPHHGHLDIGQFVVAWRGQFFISELGRMYYDEKYFDDARWDYPHASSVGHNVIFVNGELQIPGKMRGKPWNYDVGGKVLDFKSSDKRDYVIMDPTNAYPKKELKGWRRHVTLEKPLITVVVDEVKSAKGAEIEARFHSECDIKSAKNYVLLKGKEGNMALIPVVDSEFSFREGKHAIQPVHANVPFTWAPYFGTIVKTKEENTIIGTIILPVNDDKEAREIASSVERKVDNSGNLTISFTKAGEKHTLVYNKTKDGLVLQ